MNDAIRAGTGASDGPPPLAAMAANSKVSTSGATYMAEIAETALP